MHFGVTEASRKPQQSVKGVFAISDLSGWMSENLRGHSGRPWPWGPNHWPATSALGFNKRFQYWSSGPRIYELMPPSRSGGRTVFISLSFLCQFVQWFFRHSSCSDRESKLDGMTIARRRVLIPLDQPLWISSSSDPVFSGGCRKTN